MMRTVLHRLKDKLALVSGPRLVSLRARSYLSSKIKIGFGPIKTGENDLNVRAWRIDPIVSEINRTSRKYVADLFFEGDDLRRFDILIVVKVYGDTLIEDLQRARGTQTVIFDAVDNPLGCRRNFYEDTEFQRLLNGVIVSSPAQLTRMPGNGVTTYLIEHPVISRTHKTRYLSTSSQIRVIWQGFQHNRGGITDLEAIVAEAARITGQELKLIYHTNMPASDNGRVEFLPWTVDNAFTALTTADIAVTVRDNDRPFQAEKPSTKVIMYMGVGLPLICSPTVADELVIENGKTGFLARDENEWLEHLCRLALDAQLRERIGTAAYHEACEKYSVSRITEKYITFIDSIHEQRPHSNLFAARAQ